MVRETDIQRGTLSLAVEVVGEGKPLIWAHGLMATKELTLEVLNGLTDYAVLAYDERGHGASTPIRDRRLYDLNEMAEDLRACLDHVGWPTAIVGGDSMGAIIAAEFGVLYPERVRGLILDIPAIGRQTNVAMEAEANAALLRRGGVEAYISRRLDNVPGEQRELLRHRLEFMLAHDRTSVALAYEAVGAWRHETSTLRAIPAPTVIRAWRDDQVHPFALAVEIAETIPDAVLYEVSSELNGDVEKNRASLKGMLVDLEKRIDAYTTGPKS